MGAAGTVLYKDRVFLSLRGSFKNTLPMLPCCPSGPTTGVRAGRVVNWLVPTPPTARWTPNGLQGRGSDAVVECKSMRNLVDLDGFEPSTSSMPFKKYQSLTDTSTRNKRLSTRGFGRRWTPRGDFWASGLRADSRTPHRRLAGGVLSRAVVGSFQMLSAGDDNNSFPYKDDAQVGVRGGAAGL